MYYVKKRLEIAACHRLALSYESKCANLHGHNWIITVYCKAKELNAKKVNIYKTEIMVYLRLEDYTKAIELLSSYYDAANAEIAKLSENNQDLLFKEYDSFLRKEMDWASNMLIKIRSMSLQE